MGSFRNSKEEQRWLDKLLMKSYEYLHNNFHKLTENNRVKIALEIAKKSITDKVEHSGDLDIKSILKDGRDRANK